jgi:chromosome segregation ATPase
MMTVIKTLMGTGGFIWVAAAILAFGAGLGGAAMHVWLAPDIARLETKLAKTKGDIDALNSNIASCNAATTEAKRVADVEREKSQAREAGINDAFTEARKIADAQEARRTATLTKPFRGTTECERVMNAVDDHFRGGVKP